MQLFWFCSGCLGSLKATTSAMFAAIFCYGKYRGERSSDHGASLCICLSLRLGNKSFDYNVLWGGNAILSERAD
jgi:hypothetical protein